jgi:ribosomal protein S27AE
MELSARTAELSLSIRTKPLMTCAQCGEAIHMARWSEHLDERRVRHEWECEACGYNFETLACFPAD